MGRNKKNNARTRFFKPRNYSKLHLGVNLLGKIKELYFLSTSFRFRLGEVKRIKKWSKYLKNAESVTMTDLYTILGECSYLELVGLFSKCPNRFKDLLSLSYLQRDSYELLCSDQVPIKRNAVESIGLMTYAIKHHANLIIKFIENKKLVDCAVLSGDYNTARKIINETNESISYSFWAGTYLIKIEYLEKGLKASSDYLQQFNSCTESSLKVFKSAYSIYLYDLIYSNDSSQNIGLNYNSNFLLAHCSPFTGIDDEDMDCEIFNSSIIDLYNYLIYYLQNASNKILSNHKLRCYLKELNSSVNDDYLRKYCYLFGISNKASYNLDREIIFDHYINHEYDEVLYKLKKYLEINIDDFEMQVIFIKTLLIKGDTITQPDDRSSLIKSIQYYLFEFLSHKSNHDYFETQLRHLCRTQFQINGLRLVYTLLENYDSSDIYSVYQSLWKYSRYNSPFDACFFKNRYERKKYIESIPYSHNNIFWDRVFSKSPNAITDECYELSIASLSEEKVFELLKERYDHEEYPIYLKNFIATLIFNYLLKINKEKGICFFVDNRLKDSVLNIDFKDQGLVNDILKDYDLKNSIPLDLSIFGEMVGAEPNPIYFCYLKYLNKCGVSKASEIIIKNDVKQKFFLEKVVSLNVLDLHTQIFKDVLAMKQERIAICTNLYNFYHDKKMNDEVSSICRDITILKLNKQVDESKIYVDVQSIQEEVKEANITFDLFQSISGTSSVNNEGLHEGRILSNLLQPGDSSVVWEQEGETNNDVSKPIEIVNLRKSRLLQIFKIIREQFLFNSKYGLDIYLSTRIRHGTLVNQLRNHFTEKNLVTNKNNDKYTDNEYWAKNQLNLKGRAYVKCIQSFATFSSGIDKIIKDLKFDYIQVQTELNKTKEKGCFDFDIKHFSKFINQLLIDNSITTFDDCYRSIIEQLWLRTEECLKDMKNVLSRAQNDMLHLLHELQKDIYEIVGGRKKRLTSFNDAVSYCQNGIQNDFQIVNRWFKRSSHADFDFTIGMVIDTCMSVISRFGLLYVNRQIISSATIQGRFFGTFYDIFHDALNNVIDYVNSRGLPNKCSISVFEDEDNMHIKICNNILEEDIPALSQKILEIKNSFEDNMEKGKTRGDKGSGCFKIYNAVKYHLGSSSNEYDINIDKVRNLFMVEITVELKTIVI